MKAHRTIWQYWEGKPMPPWVQLCRETLLRHHPGEVVLMNREEFEALSGLEVGHLRPHHQSDVYRAWVLAHRGGMYLDVDCIVFRPLEPLFETLDSGYPWLGYTQWPKMRYRFDSALQAGHMGNPVSVALYMDVVERAGGKPKWEEIGPWAVTRAVHAFEMSGGEVYRVPCEFVRPHHYRKKRRMFLEEGTDEEHQGGRWLENVNPYTQMLSHSALGVARSWDRDTLLGSPSYISYLFRRALQC